MAGAVRGALPPDNELVSGVVVSVNPLAVSVRGGIVTRSLGVLGSYVPAVGDTVQMLRQDATWLILGSGGTGADASLTTAGFNDDTAAATTVNAAYSNINPVRFDFMKRFATTGVRVDLSVSCYTTTAATKPRFGLDFINAPSIRRDVMEMLINTANEHTMISAQTVFSGFPAGTYTVQLLWLRVAGAGTLTINADDWVSLLVTEVS
jgi:hypothetical protein